MREGLKSSVGERLIFTAHVERFGFKRAFRGSDLTTILLTNVVSQSGEAKTDHVWFTCGKAFNGVKVGDKIQFAARIDYYEKGHWHDREIDLRLKNPTKIDVIGHAEPVLCAA